MFNDIFGTDKPKRKTVPRSILKEIVARAKGKCEKCGCNLSGITYHIHHKRGLSNSPSNLAVLCPTCHLVIRKEHSANKTKRKGKIKKSYGKTIADRLPSVKGKLDL